MLRELLISITCYNDHFLTGGNLIVTDILLHRKNILSLLIDNRSRTGFLNLISYVALSKKLKNILGKKSIFTTNFFDEKEEKRGK